MLRKKERMLSLIIKTHWSLLYLLSNCPQVQTTFYDWSVTYVLFDDFSTWLLDYITIYCQHKGSLWLWSTDKYVDVLFKAKLHH